MYISETVITIVVGLVGVVLVSILSSLVVLKVAEKLELLPYSKLDDVTPEDLLVLIARAEARGIDIPERLRSEAGGVTLAARYSANSRRAH